MNVSRFIKIKRKKEDKICKTTMWCVRVTTVEEEMQQYIVFSMLSHKRQDFRGCGGVTEHKIFSTNVV
jgi:hypothetical protein